MSVRIDGSLRLPPSEYIAEAFPKSGIAIYHTVGGRASTTVPWWQSDRTNGGRRRAAQAAFQGVLADRTDRRRRGGPRGGEGVAVKRVTHWRIMSYRFCGQFHHAVIELHHDVIELRNGV